MTPTERLGVATNAVGWALYAPDDQVDGEVNIDAEQLAIARKVAERVVSQLDEFDRRSS